jgi:hypothetical protein
MASITINVAMMMSTQKIQSMYISGFSFAGQANLFVNGTKIIPVDFFLLLLDGK